MDHEKLVVIPDTHGHYDQARQLVDKLDAEGYLEERKLVFLGDYYDRGPAIRQLVDFAIELQELGHVMLAGNHEYALLKALEDGPDRNRWVGRWVLAYQKQTLASYGVVPKSEWSRMDQVNALRERMPPTHLEFLRSLPWVYQAGSLIVVHAGLDPGRSADEQVRNLENRVEEDRWEPPQLRSRKLALPTARIAGKCIVSGHTTYPEPYVSSERVLLDCGVDIGGPLVAWVADSGEIISHGDARDG
ncbi:serine/threonine protein phosphatase [Candidatus Saccharibacteria bacterium]|nr:serine/threonine protein phosphatase [Candidatus Saccharibacteria bacterium]